MTAWSQKTKKCSHHTHGTNCKDWARGLAALLQKPNNEPVNSTCLKYTPIHDVPPTHTRMYGWVHSGITVGSSKPQAPWKLGSLLLGMVRHQASCLPHAGSSHSSSHLHTPSLRHPPLGHCFSFRRRNLMQSCTRSRQLPYFGYFNTDVKPKPTWENTALENSKPGMPGGGLTKT